MPPETLIVAGRHEFQEIFRQFGQSVGIELVYTFVIIVSSLMIYFSTKEMYELTGHRGIKYFRLSFLFFAIAFFFRSFIKIIFILFEVNIHDVFPQILAGPTTLFLFMYMSALAVFYLIYSVVWKKWGDSQQIVLLFHIIAITVALISVISQSQTILLIIHVIFLAAILSTILILYSEPKRKKNKLYAVYVLLFIFWIFNVLDIHVPNFFQFFQLIIYFILIGLFLAILYKVLRSVGST